MRILCMKRILICLLSSFCVNMLQIGAQSVDKSDWMALLPDDMLVASVSMPGAHDAATYKGVLMALGLGRTQVANLSAQWESGVRAFDLRPAVRDTALHIYHSVLRTGVSFQDAIQEIFVMLDKHPNEFAVVLLRHESESENEREKLLWPDAIGRAIEGLGEKAAMFHPQMMVGEMRGKVLFLSRNVYHGTRKGAMVTGWSHASQGTDNARIYANGEEAQLQVQDYYAPTTDERRQEKLRGVKKMLSLARTASQDVWTINFLSGYSKTALGGNATTHGYKANAQWLHSRLLEETNESNTVSAGRMGIVFMDFVGMDKVCGGLWHWKAYGVQSNKLSELVIESNFR